MSSFFSRGSAPPQHPPNQPQTDRYGRPVGAQQPYQSLPDDGYSSRGQQPQRPPSGPSPAFPPRPSQQQQGGYDEKPRSSATPSSRRAGGGSGGRFACDKGDEASAVQNCAFFHPQDLDGPALGRTQYVRIRRQFVMLARSNPGVRPGTFWLSRAHRTWAGTSLQEEVDVEPIDVGGEGAWLGGIDFEVGFAKPAEDHATVFSADEIARFIVERYPGLPLSIGEPIAFEFKGINLKASVKSLGVTDLSSGAGRPAPTMGILVAETDVSILKEDSSRIKIKASAKKPPPNAILQPNFRFEDMGIGGLDHEFSAIFRRAFASRIFPPGLVEKLGIQHVKGLLLFGPPGTGKTLMARQIGKMLNAREPKIVNGPEILNKFVGQSEENIRKLFEDAEKEYKAKGDESGLHIIIFDELDAICKQRGSTGGGTGVGDSVVNQLLSKMDGVDQLNNILIIGMTNRLDMIDEALLRPGRLEVHMEISLPDEHGRLQILNIHTSKMKANGVMASDVDVRELAAVTKNFSGAEIGGLIKSATSFAMNRHIKVGTVAGISNDLDAMQVGRADFLLALDEVHAAFGVSEAELQQVVQNGIIHFDPRVDAILKDGNLYVEQVRQSQRTPLVSVLVHGPPGSGKTALAATIAMASGFPFIKLVSPENMVGFGEAQKVAYLNKVFMDSYKSPLSVVVVDSIERILDWVPVGPRFSNSVLQALLVLVGKRPPKGNRLLILCTTSNLSMLTEMEMATAFDATIRVPALSSLSAIDAVLREVDLFNGSERERRKCLDLLTQSGFGNDGAVSVGVKKLLSLVEMARQDPDPAETFAANLMELASA